MTSAHRARSHHLAYARVIAFAASVMTLIAAPITTHAQAASAGAGLCKGLPPVEGARLRGPVLAVPDGRTLCVAQGLDPSLWIALQVTDAPTATARSTLMAVAFGKDVDCVVRKNAAALCTLDGRSVGELSASSGMAQAGASWRESRATGAGRLADRTK